MPFMHRVSAVFVSGVFVMSGMIMGCMIVLGRCAFGHVMHRVIVLVMRLRAVIVLRVFTCHPLRLLSHRGCGVVRFVIVMMMGMMCVVMLLMFVLVFVHKRFSLLLAL